jgi:hypothetical protein
VFQREPHFSKSSEGGHYSAPALGNAPAWPSGEKGGPPIGEPGLIVWGVYGTSSEASLLSILLFSRWTIREVPLATTTLCHRPMQAGQGHLSESSSRRGLWEPGDAQR